MFGNTVEKIEKLAQKGHYDKIVEHLNDKNAAARLAAIDALGQCKDDVGFNALVPLVHSADRDVRIHTAQALSVQKQPRARAYLEHQLHSEQDPEVVKAIDEALSKISDPD